MMPRKINFIIDSLKPTFAGEPLDFSLMVRLIVAVTEMQELLRKSPDEGHDDPACGGCGESLWLSDGGAWGVCQRCWNKAMGG